MTRDDIIRMALEAGFLDRKESCPLSGDSRFDEEICVGEYPVGEIVERFAALVAAHEREQCARVCEDTILTTTLADRDYNLGCLDCAKAIRARGEA